MLVGHAGLLLAPRHQATCVKAGSSCSLAPGSASAEWARFQPTPSSTSVPCPELRTPNSGVLFPDCSALPAPPCPETGSSSFFRPQEKGTMGGLLGPQPSTPPPPQQVRPALYSVLPFSVRACTCDGCLHVSLPFRSGRPCKCRDCVCPPTPLDPYKWHSS